jgi:hypothetical protein
LYTSSKRERCFAPDLESRLEWIETPLTTTQRFFNQVDRKNSTKAEFLQRFLTGRSGIDPDELQLYPVFRLASTMLTF